MRSDAPTILLVDDEAAVRALISTILRRAGYHVIAAESTDDAIVQAAVAPGAVCLIISDVMLPAGTGAPMAARLLAAGMEAPVLFISGYDAPMLLRQGRLLDASRFLQKPFTGAELLIKARQLIELAPEPIGREPAACAS